MSAAAAATCSAHSSSQPSASCSQYDGQSVHQQLHSPRAAPQTSYSQQYYTSLRSGQCMYVHPVLLMQSALPIFEQPVAVPSGSPAVRSSGSNLFCWSYLHSEVTSLIRSSTHLLKSGAVHQYLVRRPTHINFIFKQYMELYVFILCSTQYVA